MAISIEKELVVKAILDTLTPEKRDELLQGAIASMFEEIKEGPRRADRGKTQLQLIYESTAYDVTVKAMDPESDQCPSLIHGLATHFTEQSRALLTSNG